RPHRRGIKLPVSLRAGPSDGRTLAAVEHAKLDATGIRHAAHQAIKRVNLTDQMSLAKAADGGVAGHRPDGRKTVRDEAGRCAKASSRCRGLATGMAAADHDDIECVLSGLHGADFYREIANAGRRFT